MAKMCPITNKTSLIAGGYSNRIRATKFNPTGNVRKRVNFQKKTVFIPELNKKMTLTLSSSAIRTLNKKGVYATLKEAGII
ncbi:MAG TPA: L28 family ribosomal protein [Candidatus Paceibacterota bacterium]